MICNYNEVYDFWFGGDQSINYKTKWFPSGSSGMQLEADNIVYEKFNYVFELAMQCELDHWKENAKSFMSLIIVLDQFSRHIFRKDNLDGSDPKRNRADTLALASSEEFVNRFSDWDESCSIAEIVFILMPFRHSATVHRLEFVMRYIEKRDGILKDGIDLLDKFRKQTVRRLQHLQDRARVTADNEVLEWQGFDTDSIKNDQIRMHPLYTTLYAFLQKHMKNVNNTIAVSLSGGIN